MPIVKMAPVDRAAIGRIDSPSEPSVGEEEEGRDFIYLWSSQERHRHTVCECRSGVLS